MFSCSNIVQDEYFIEPILDCMCMFDWAITVCLYLSMKKTASCVNILVSIYINSPCVLPVPPFNSSTGFSHN